MIVSEQLKRYQPEVYNFLIKCFDLDMNTTDRKKPENFVEDDPKFRKYRNIMTEKSGVSM